MSTPFAISVGNLPPNTCLAIPQAFAQQLASILQITANPADFTFPVGSTVPGPINNRFLG